MDGLKLSQSLVNLQQAAYEFKAVMIQFEAAQLKLKEVGNRLAIKVGQKILKNYVCQK